MSDASNQRTPRKRVDPAVNEFATFALEEAEDNRVLRTSLWFAVVFHALLLLINFPAFQEPPEADPGPRVMQVYQIERYRPKPPPPEYIPPKRVRRTPVPDPTPDDPEPIRREEPVADSYAEP